MKIENRVLLTLCRLCNIQYEAERSECPECGLKNISFVSSSFVKFEIEIERALYTAIQRWSKDLKINAFIVEAIEEKISRLNTPPRK